MAKKRAVKKRSASKKTIKKKKAIKRAPKKRVSKKAAPKSRLKKRIASKTIQGKIIGTVTHYFPHVQAAVIKLKGALASGDTIRIKGHTTDFTQTISSMQIDHVPITEAKKGQEIGLLVGSRVRQHDMVIKE